MLSAERQRLAAQTGRGVGDGQADQVGLATVSELRLNLDRGVDLLAGLVQGQQRGVGFKLAEQGQLLDPGNLDFFSL
ncbi:hypothetical protein D3C75_1152490 [compost metagenome]